MKAKVYLVLISVAILFVLAQAGNGQKSSPQAWEYKTLLRIRSIDDNPGGILNDRRGSFAKAKPWEFWQENSKELPAPVNIDAKLEQLGAQGWELVTVCPRSSNGNAGSDNGLSFSFNGVTTEDIWVFKRPKL